jgi:hypothetical protein
MRRSLSRERGRDSTTLKKLCFYSMEIQCMERFKDIRSKTYYQKKPKCLKNERPLQ